MWPISDFLLTVWTAQVALNLTFSNQNQGTFKCGTESDTYLIFLNATTIWTARSHLIHSDLTKGSKGRVAERAGSTAPAVGEHRRNCGRWEVLKGWWLCVSAGQGSQKSTRGTSSASEKWQSLKKYQGQWSTSLQERERFTQHPITFKDVMWTAKQKIRFEQ